MRKLIHSTEQPKVFNSPDIINHTIRWDDDEEDYYDDEEDYDWDEDDEDDIIPESKMSLNVYSNRLSIHRHDLSHTKIQKPTYEELEKKISELQEEISDLEDARYNAYSDGHSAGYVEGKNDGYDEGYNEGYSEGYDEGYDDAKTV